jgi:hypothetical protein
MTETLTTPMESAEAAVARARSAVVTLGLSVLPTGLLKAGTLGAIAGP